MQPNIDAASIKKNTPIKVIMGGSIGNFIEYFDWYVYSSTAIYFSAAFFPAGDSTAKLLKTALIFAIGFLMRPIGAWILGSYADRHGRMQGLTISVACMCLGSLIIALSPTYATIGGFAPALLVIARLLQGLSLGGEYGSSATYLTEMAPVKKRGYYSSFQYVTLIGGQVAASLLLIFLEFVIGEKALLAWGWRIPFLMGAILSIIAFYIRLKLPEPPVFIEKVENNPEVWQRLHNLYEHRFEILVVVGFTLGGTALFYTLTTYMQKFLFNTSGFSKMMATEINCLVLFYMAALQPIIGIISDRVGRRPILFVFATCGILGIVPMMTALSHTNQPLMAIFLLVMGVSVLSCYTAVNAVVKAELFPPILRSLGVSLPYALTVCIFGGTAEYVALWFKTSGIESGFYWYIAATLLISLITCFKMKETRYKNQ